MTDSTQAAPQPQSGPSPSFIAGLIGGLVSFAAIVVVYILGDNEMLNSVYRTTSMVVFAAAFAMTIIYSIYNTHAISNRADLDIRKSIAAGVKGALFMALVYGLLRFLFFEFVAHEVVDQAMDEAAKSMREKGIVGADLEKNVKLTRRLLYGSLSIPALLLFYAIVGMFFSLIASFVMRALRG